MVDIQKDNRKWTVKLTTTNEKCFYLYYPANYHGCRLLENTLDDSCTLENCPNNKD